MKVLITGASSGIGLSAAIYLIHMGYDVIGTSRNPSLLNIEAVKKRYINDYNKYKIKNGKVSVIKNTANLEILEKIDEIFRKIEYIKLDITNDEEVKKTIPMIMEKGIDILINNAGGAYFGPIESLSMDNAHKQFDLNYFGHLNVIQQALPFLRKNKGRIINIASLSSTFPMPFSGHYSTTKSAIKILTEVLALELNSFGIKVSSICPGVINTPFNSNMHSPEAGSGKDTLDSSQIDSDMLQKMIDAFPIPKDNVYHAASKRNWEYIIKRMLLSSSPEIVTKSIFKAITSRNPKLHYYPASLDQYLGYLLYRRLVGDKTKMKILKSMNKL